MLTRLDSLDLDDTLHPQRFPSLPEMSRLQQAFLLVLFLPPLPNAQLAEALPPSVQPCCLCWNARIAQRKQYRLVRPRCMFSTFSVLLAKSLRPQTICGAWRSEGHARSQGLGARGPCR